MKIYLYWVFICSIFILNCSEKKEKKEVGYETIREIPLEMAKNVSLRNHVDLKFLGSIGSDTDEKYVFNDIKCMQVDNEGNLYVLDRSFKNIRMFNDHGYFIKEYKMTKGQGPGEYLDPVSFAISDDYRFFYISDMDNRRLTILDRDFNYINSFTVNTFYFDVLGGLDNNIITLFYSSFGRKLKYLIHYYNQEGEQIAKYGLPQEHIDELREKRIQGAIYAFMVKSDSLLFISFGCPYEIRVYDISGYKLLRRFYRKTSFYGTEFREGEFVLPSGRCVGLATINNSLLLNFVKNMKTKQTYIHLFDFEGHIKGTIDLSKFNLGEFSTLSISIGSKNVLYLKAQEPFPRILKFKVVY